VSGVTAHFVVDGRHSRPAAVAVQAFDGSRWRPVSGARITWAGASGEPSTVTFAPVSATRLRLDLTSAKPQAPDGAIGITEVTVVEATP
jgi:beta-galactosidase